MTTHRIRLLLIDDDPERVRLFKAWAPPDILVREAMDGGQALGSVQNMNEDDYAGIMLDHDLHKSPIDKGSKPTVSGMQIARRLAERRLLGVPVLVHSMNITGGPAMAQVLKGAGYDVEQVRFRDLDKERFQGWVDRVCVGLR